MLEKYDKILSKISKTIRLFRWIAYINLLVTSLCVLFSITLLIALSGSQTIFEEYFLFYFPAHVIDKTLTFIPVIINVITLILIYLWFEWIFRSINLINISGVTPFSRSPLTSIFAHFVPIAFSYLPMSVLTELVEKNVQDEKEFSKLNRLAATTWLCYAISIVVELCMVRRFGDLPTELGPFRTYLAFTIVRDIGKSIAFMLGIKFMCKLFHYQKQ